MAKKLLIAALVVLVLSVGSFFLPAREVSIESIGRLSFESKITLSVGSEVAYANPDTIINSPTANSGGWTNPQNAYTDDGTYAYVMSGMPSVSHTYSGYGFNLTGNQINQVRVRYDAWCATGGISYIGSASATGNNPTSGSFSLPGGWAAGDTAIFWWYTRSSTKTFTPPPTITQKQQAASSGYGRIYIGYRVLQSGDSTFPWTSSWANDSTTIWGTSVFRGVDTTGDPFEAQSGAPATFTNVNDPNPPPVTTLSSNAWVIPIFGKDDNYTSITPPTNYTSAGSNSSGWGDDASAGVAYRQIATPGLEDPGAWTLTGGDGNDDGYVWTGALRPSGAQQIRVDVSWDGGISWSAQQVTTLTGAEATYWYDVTGATTWTPDKLSDANLRVRVDAYALGTPGEVRLDWLPVQVDYTPPGGCWLCGWDKRVKLAIDYTDIGAPLTNFPVLVYLSTSSGRGGDNLSFIFNELQSDANRFKIAVTTDDCATQCYVEIEKWDQASQRAWLWVRVPSISNTADTILHLYYDRDHADNTAYVGDTDSLPAQMVWDGNFVLVQHLGENATVVHDSTVNNNDETNPPPPPPSGDPDPGYVRAVYTDSGRVDGAYSFAPIGGDGTRLQMNHSTSLDITQAITLEAFVYLNDRTDGKFIAKDDPFPGGAGCYCLQQEANNLEIMLDFGGWYRASYGTYNTGEWIYLVGTYDRVTMRLYLNAVERATNPQTSPITSNNLVALGLGNRAYDIGTSYDLNGMLDEVRISNTTRSPQWILASYESGRDNLIDYGAEELIPQDLFNTPSSKDFGNVAPNSFYWANGAAPTFPLDDGECFFMVTNNSPCPLNISIRATNFSGGVGWTLAGTPGPNIVTLKAGKSGDLNEGVMVIITTSDQPFISTLASSTSLRWELKLETGTFGDYAQKTSTITLTATSS